MLEKVINKTFFYFRALLYMINLLSAIFVFKVLYRGQVLKGLISMGSSNGKYCGDNIFSLLQYLDKKSKNVIYIIDKQSKDRKKLNEIGRVLNRFSFKANLNVLRSQFIIYDTSFVDLIRCDRKILKHILKINIFHGIHGLKKIDKKNADQRLQNDDFIIATSQHEKKIKEDWGFSVDRILLTGLPRYDTLLKKSKEINTENKIFYMPTWRPWFNKGYLNPSKKDLEVFENSDYFRNILLVASSNELNNMLKANKYSLEIYVHKLMYRYMKKINFNNIPHMSNINFLNENNVNIQNQIVKSKMLITDYSSVFFDFLYINKPVVFYQFDKQEYYDRTTGSYISDNEIKEMIVYKLSELIHAIEKTFNSNFKVSDEAYKLVKKYVKYHDRNNCSRIEKEMKKLF